MLHRVGDASSDSEISSPVKQKLTYHGTSDSEVSASPVKKYVITKFMAEMSSFVCVCGLAWYKYEIWNTVWNEIRMNIE